MELRKFDFTQEQKTQLVDEAMEYLSECFQDIHVSDFPSELVEEIKMALLNNLKRLVTSTERNESFLVNLDKDALKATQEFLTNHFNEKLEIVVSDHGTELSHDVKELLSA